ncbi:TIR domain-containing protein [Phthorimaea operculella]|nr:TIR domain-containing protein [Phthorimaea operculella]
MIEAAPNLRTLKINNCRLFDLPIEMLNCATHLVHLDLSDNNLYDDRFGNFPSIKTLETLDLSKNPILGESGLGSLVVKLPALKALLLRDQNDIYNFCDGGNINIKTNLIIPLQNSSLEYLDFGSTPTDINCIEDTHFSKLKRVIIYQPRGSFEPLKMPLTDAGHMEIDFDPSTLFRIRFSEADYETLRTENSTNTRRNLTILLNYIRCDVCANAWLVRALKDFPHIMSIPGLRCNDQNGNYVLEEPVERMECDKTDGDGCVYKRNWSDMTVIAECSEWFWNETHTPNKTAFEYPLYGLNVSGLKLTTFQSKWPDSQWIDLRHNRLSHGTAEQASALFVGGRRVWLADNLLICDCNNRPLLDAIQHHREQVKDYDQLNCVETGQPVNSVSTDVLCQVAKTVSLRWCLRCLHNPDSDDKPYDAFISFAHEDQEYVMNTLLPGLEQGPEQFRVCVHYRDWHVGDWIPAQIMRSVQLSKRTLIVLSRSFVASTWSTFEFRYSISNADEDPNAKVLVLVKDDVLDMKLDMEIRGYLTYNTYLRCDDPWFWEKLRYGMPHRVKSKTARNRELEGVRGQELYMENINVAITFPDEE